MRNIVGMSSHGDLQSAFNFLFYYHGIDKLVHGLLVTLFKVFQCLETFEQTHVMQRPCILSVAGQQVIHCCVEHFSHVNKSDKRRRMQPAFVLVQLWKAYIDFFGQLFLD